MSLETFSISDLWEAAFRHKVKLLLTPLAVLALAAGVILFFPRTFRSEAKIFLQVGRDSVGIDPTATTGQTISLMQSGRDDEVKSTVELLGSRGVMGKVVDELGADYVLRGGPSVLKPRSALIAAVKDAIAGVLSATKYIDPISDREEAILQLEETLGIRSERGSTVIVMTLEADTAVGAQKMLDTLIGVYQKEHMRVHRNEDSGDFFADQQRLLQEQLDAAQAKLLEAKNKMGLASVEERRGTIESQLQSVSLDYYQTQQQLTTARAHIADVRQQLAHIPDRLTSSVTSKPNEGADLLRDQLYERQIQLLDLQSRYQDAHPLVQAVSAQVEEARKVVNAQAVDRSETTKDVNPLHRELTLDLKRQESLVAGLESRLSTLTEQQRLIHEDLEQLNRNEVELDQLARVEQMARDKFFQYANNFEQARMDKALQDEQVSSISIAQSATLDEKPVKPNKLLVALGGVMLALTAPIGWAAASEKMNTRIRGEKDAAGLLDLPVLAEVPDNPLYGRILSR